jgi:DnaJ family protein B protein 4
VTMITIPFSSRLQDPNDIFSQIFGAASPFSPFGGMGGAGPSGASRGPYEEYMDVDDLPGSPFGGPVFGSRPGSQRKRANSFTGAGAGTSNDTGEKEKAGEIVKPLRLSLEELYKGTTKKLKLTRKLLNGRTEEKVVEIIVRILYSGPPDYDDALC